MNEQALMDRIEELVKENDRLKEAYLAEKREKLDWTSSAAKSMAENARLRNLLQEAEGTYAEVWAERNGLRVQANAVKAENDSLRKGLREVLDHMKNGTTWYPHKYEALLRGEDDGTQRTS